MYTTVLLPVTFIFAEFLSFLKLKLGANYLNVVFFLVHVTMKKINL